nr:glutathione binding-like protein [Dyella humicola]
MYYLPGACTLAGHIVLEWIGAPYEAVRLGHDSLKTSARQAQPGGLAVPMLEHTDFALTENMAMLGYLADLHPETGLLGDGTPRARAEIMGWLGFLCADVHMAFLPIFKASLFLKEETLAGALAENAREHVRTQLEQLDARLDGRDWLAGTRSVADAYLFVILRWAVGMDIGLYGLDHLMRFARRMEADPAVQAALFAEEGIPA